jgi:hypothetical protein
MSDGQLRVGGERYWKNRAGAVARRVNLGWWLDRFNRLLVVGLVLFAVSILILRSYGSQLMNGHLPEIALAALVGLAVIVALIISRRKFIDREEGLVRLDDRLALCNRLVTAESGVGKWPTISNSEQVDAAPRWAWPMVLLPSFLAMVIVAVAWFVPLPEAKADEPLVVNEPEPWEQMEEWIDTLDEEELIDPESLREVEERLEELRDQPEEEWFSHASMEATDTLKETLGRDLKEMANDMETLERDLEALRSFSTEMSEEGKEMLMREMEEAMKGLQANGLEMNEKLAKQLGNIDPSKLGQESMKNLSPEQLKQLQKQLGECSQCLGSLEGLPSSEPGQKLGNKSGQQPGNGGISRGRGDAPLYFGDEEDLKTNQIEGVTNEDRSRAAMGDLLALGETEHDDEENNAKTSQGGAVASQGKGGEAVWRESLLPNEKAVLKRYFK